MCTEDASVQHVLTQDSHWTRTLRLHGSDTYLVQEALSDHRRQRWTIAGQLEAAATLGEEREAHTG